MPKTGAGFVGTIKENPKRRLKSLTYDANLLAEFQLTSLEDRLRPENLPNPRLEELFHNLAECFQRG